MSPRTCEGQRLDAQEQGGVKMELFAVFSHGSMVDSECFLCKCYDDAIAYIKSEWSKLKDASVTEITGTKHDIPVESYEFNGGTIWKTYDSENQDIEWSVHKTSMEV